MIKGLIFDFDGLILDTEYAFYTAWQEIFEQNHCSLPLEDWGVGLGTSIDAFDPVSYLEKIIPNQVDRVSLEQQAYLRSNELIAVEKVLPGIREAVLTANEMGLKLAVASSSPREWVQGHLTRLGLIDYFDLIRSQEDVLRVKPDPALFLSALAGMGLQPDEAVVFEDSPLGITAAKAAGIFCVAIPNRISQHLAVEHADRVIASLEVTSLKDLLQEIEKASQPNHPFQAAAEGTP